MDNTKEIEVNCSKCGDFGYKLFDTGKCNNCGASLDYMTHEPVLIYQKKPIRIYAYLTKEQKVIKTLEGNMTANVGDYIITGVNGEQYPCKPDIFKKSYEEVEE